MSLVRDNLMTVPGYTPYCATTTCFRRTVYRNGQFHCLCGWQSRFDGDFIAKYEAKWAEPAALARTEDGGRNDG